MKSCFVTTKTYFAKTGVALLLLGFPHGARARGDELGTVPHWTDTDQKIVFYVPRPALKVSLYPLRADDQYWDQMDVEVSYDGVDLERQLKVLRAAFPGYRLSRPILEKSGDFHLSIPAIGVDENVETLPGSAGPFMHWVRYIPRSQSDNLRRALTTDLGAAVKVMGNVGAEVPAPQVLERVNLDDTTCSGLLEGDGTVASLIRNFSRLRVRIDGMSLKFRSTRESLERSVLEGCFLVRQNATITSFQELMSTELIPKEPAFRPRGETVSSTPVLRVVPLYYDLTRDIR